MHIFLNKSAFYWLHTSPANLTASKNFEIGSCDPDHAHFGNILWTIHGRGPSSMSAPNLKRISLFVQTL